MNSETEITTSDSFCETCAERGRPNEPVYRMGMCRFCYQGVAHPKATSSELRLERMGAHAERQKPQAIPQSEHPDISSLPDGLRDAKVAARGESISKPSRTG